VYLLVVGVSMMVVTIGVGSALAARADLARQSLAVEVARAEWAANGALELAVSGVVEGSINPRILNHMQWIRPTTIGGVVTGVMMVDPDDGVLSDDVWERVQVVSRAEIGGAAQYRSVILEPRKAGSSDTTEWRVVPRSYRVEAAP
jgi:hypothetical protein